MNMIINLPNIKPSNSHIVCRRCVMDTSDPTIKFDSGGVCDYCHHYDQNIKKLVSTKHLGPRDDYKKISKLINQGCNEQESDCLVGFSGGLDSSWLLHLLVTDIGVHPLVVHVNGGWDNAQACDNIRKIVEQLNLNFHTIVIDWQEMRNIQLAFFKADVPFLDVPQDMAFFSALYDFAIGANIKKVITGANYVTECVREPEAWGAYPGNDPRYVKAITKSYGQHSIGTFPMRSSINSRIIDRYLRGLKIYKPLNYYNYSMKTAEGILEQNYGWRKFPAKHHESTFTKFIEGYWLPYRFDVDRRKAHLSSLILTEQLSREEAIKLLKEPAYPTEQIRYDFSYIADKLEISEGEFLNLLTRPRYYTNIRSSKFLGYLANVQSLVSKEKRYYK